MRALIVGAGSVGQVFGHHLARGGAEVSFLVKPKYADDCRRGFTLYPLGRRPPRAQAFAAAGVLTAPEEAAGTAWDQIVVAVARRVGLPMPPQVRHLVHEGGRRILGVVPLEVSRVEGDLVSDLIADVAPPLGRKEAQAPSEPGEVQDHITKCATEQHRIEAHAHAHRADLPRPLAQPDRRRRRRSGCRSGRGRSAR
jgi:hypothetical protein